ncbi:MAG: TRZ/ATZ family hydrolase [Gammaproteobacteria bacterium]
MSQRIDALICPRWTIAVEPDTDVQTDVAVAIDKGRILALLPRGEATGRFEPDALHERPDHVLLPGLVNAHTHAAMSLMRGYADDMPLSRWLEERIWPTELNLVNADFVADGTRLAVAELLRGGTSCFADMYFFPDKVAEVAVETGIRAAVGMIAIDFPSPWAATPDEYINKGLAVHDAYRTHPLVSTFFAPHAPYSVSDETLRRIRQLADELEVPVQMHVHETAREVEDAVSQSGQRPLQRLEELGLLNPALIAVHATQLLDSEIETLALAGSSVVHCPRSNLKLASGACPVAELLAAGVNTALGTDGAASNNRLDLWAEMEMAALFGKHVAENPEAIPASAALKMATINGARALGLADEIGSLVVGKSADVICVELTEAAVRPVLDPLSQLVYCAGREQVTDVWVAGEHLLTARSLTRMEPATILERADQWGQRILDS